MALPTDLNTLDYDYQGAPFCQGPSKLTDALNTMDVDLWGMPFLANDTSQSASSQSFGLDKKWRGIPFSDAALDPALDLETLDYKSRAIPFVTNVSGGDTVLIAGTPVIQVSAPSVKGTTLERTFPLRRAEEIDSNSPLAHVFPYVAIQDPALIP